MNGNDVWPALSRGARTPLVVALSLAVRVAEALKVSADAVALVKASAIATTTDNPTILSIFMGDPFIRISPVT